MALSCAPTVILLLLLPWATASAPNPGSTARNEIAVGLPKNGVISVSTGTVTFVKGQLIVRLEYQIKGFLVRSAVNLYDRALQLLMTLTKVSLTSAHQAAVIDSISSMSYYFRMLITRTGEQVLRRLNYLSIRDMEQDWRRKLTRMKEHMGRRTRVVAGTEMRVTVEPSSNETIHTSPSSARTSRISGRKRRGLLNIGGDFLKTVLGVATEQDLDDLKESFSDLNQGVVASIQKININLVHIAATLNNMLEQAQTSITILDKLHNDLQELDTYVTVSNTLTNLREGIDYLLLVSIETEDKLSLLRIGSLPTILAYGELRDLVQEGLEVFQNAYVFPYQYTPLNYSNLLSKFELRTLDEEETFAVILPFVERQNVSLYQLQNFPMIDGKNQTVLIKNLKSNIAITRDGKTYADNIDFNMCRELGGVHVCPPGTMMNVDANPSCTVESVLHQEQLHCVMERVNLTGVLSRRVGPVCYLYVPRAEWGNLDCHDATMTTRYVELEGAYVLHSPCTITTPSFSISTIRHAFVSLPGRHLEPIPMSTINLPPAVQVPRITHLLAELKTLKSHLNETTNNMNFLTSVATVRHHFSVGSVTGLVLVFITIAIAFVLYKFPRCRRRSKAGIIFHPQMPLPPIPRPTSLSLRPKLPPMFPSQGNYLYPMNGEVPMKPVRTVLNSVPLCSTETGDDRTRAAQAFISGRWRAPTPTPRRDAPTDAFSHHKSASEASTPIPVDTPPVVGNGEEPSNLKTGVDGDNSTVSSEEGDYVTMESAPMVDPEPDAGSLYNKTC